MCSSKLGEPLLRSRRDRIALDLSGYSPAQIIPSQATRWSVKRTIITEYKDADRFCVTRLVYHRSLRFSRENYSLSVKTAEYRTLRYRWMVKYRGPLLRDTVKTQWIFIIYSPLRIILYSRIKRRNTKRSP